MLLLVLSILFLNGSCREYDDYHRSHHRERNYSNGDRRHFDSEERKENQKNRRYISEDDQFYIEVKNVDLNFGGKSLKYNTDSNYTFDIGSTIEITCKRQGERGMVTLQWKDLLGFQTGVAKGYANSAIRVLMKPNRDGNGLTLTCHSYGLVNKKISVTLNTDHEGPQIKGHTMFLKTGEAYTTNETCNGVVRYPDKNTKTKSKVIYANQKIIENFSENLNGTVVDCITYKNLGLVPSQIRNGIHSEVSTYERVTSKTRFYLEKEKTATEKMKIDGNSVMETGRKEERALETEIRHNTEGSHDSAVAIVGGVLGAIIILLISLLLIIWYRKILRQSNFDGAADQVIYAEIEDLPPQMPPPRPLEVPYAKIMGTLVPKVPEPNEDHLYCSMN